MKPPRTGSAPCHPHKQSGNGFPSDLTNAQWARLEPLIPPAKTGGRPRQTDMRAAMNAIFYLLRTGCPWRYLPRNSFPPRPTVYNIFRKFQREGSPIRAMRNGSRSVGEFSPNTGRCDWCRGQ